MKQRNRFYKSIKRIKDLIQITTNKKVKQQENKELFCIYFSILPTDK